MVMDEAHLGRRATRGTRAKIALGIGTGLLLAGAIAVGGATGAVGALTSHLPTTASTAAPVGSVLSASAGREPVVVAIGDSIMDGHGTKADQAWPVLIGQKNDWSLTNLSSDGSGFLQLGDAGDTFATQVQKAVALNPSIVIISASSNDLGQDDAALSTTTMQTMVALRTALPYAQIIALSAFWGDTTPPAELDPIDADLQAAAQTVGARYIDIGQPLSGRPGLMQGDDVHPTAEGLSVLASAIDADIEAPPTGS